MDTPDSVRIDLAEYFARIGYGGPRAVTLESLRALHLAHATSVPFENIDVLLGLPIRLDVPSLFDKLVTRRRGGYCFEQNSLLAAVLEQLGFRVARLQARVRIGTTRVLPLTHMALEVEAEGRSYLADVGFGGWGLLHPLEIADGESQQFDWSYALAREADHWVLRAKIDGSWQDLYAFTRQPHPSVDYEPPNFYVSNHHDSRFVHTFTAQRPLPHARHTLANREYTIHTADGQTQRHIASEDELLSLLSEQFGLSVPAGKWLPQ